MTNTRATLANVLSIREQRLGKSARRDRKQAVLTVVSEPTAVRTPSARQRALGASYLLRRARISRRDSLMTGVPAIANMQAGRIFSDRQLERFGIVHPRSGNRALVTAMHQLRDKLYSINPAGNYSLLVSSVVPDGGGSFVALNLAATIAFDKARSSLLLDANLHAPVLHKLVALAGNDDAPGVLDYLERPELGVERIVSTSGIPRMRIIPTGTPRNAGTEPFASPRFRELLAGIKTRYDDRFVIVDGPSVSDGAEARRLSELCDYTLLVVPYAGVTARKLDAIVDQIDDRRLAGVVLNNQPV